MKQIIKILLRLSLIFFIIVPIGMALCAEKDTQDTAGDPFLSMDDRAALIKKPLDISQLPYKITLDGIIWSDKTKIAILDGEMVEKGQVWRDFKVDDIAQDRAVLKWGDNRLELLLPLEDENEGNKK